MQVRCPHCTQVFSTQTPGDQPCPSCGASIHVPDPAASQTGGQAFGGGGVGGGFGGPAPERVPTPWERREELGLVQGWLQTLVGSAFKPQEFWPGVEPRTRFFPALLWAWITSGFALLLAVPMQFLQWGQVQQALLEAQASTGGNAEIFSRLLGGGPLPFIFGTFFVSLLLYPVGSLIVIALVHVSAKLVGAANEGFDATARAFYYAQGPQLVSFIPLAGMLGTIYSYVLFGWGIKELHRTTPGRATMALLLPLLIFCLCCCGVVFAGAGAVAAAMQGAQV
ncbi:MAG TPA: YIP1 family protein [Myxococcaceae bacterium]|nr:YIP1 family protein [Myxococcaceae bacterium]